MVDCSWKVGNGCKVFGDIRLPASVDYEAMSRWMMGCLARLGMRNEGFSMDSATEKHNLQSLRR